MNKAKVFSNYYGKIAWRRTLKIVIFLNMVAHFSKLYAAVDPNILIGPPNALNNIYPSQTIDPEKLLMLIVGIRNFILFLGVVLFIIFIVLSGIKYMSSGGDENKIEEARKMFTYAIIGGIITLGAFIIMQVVIGLVKQAIDLKALF